MNKELQQSLINQWWEKRRWKYNKALLIAGISAFVLYVISALLLIAPYDKEFEISLFTVFLQGAAYLFMMGIANIFYFLGAFIDKRFNKHNNENFRQKLFNTGLTFSACLPFLIPLLIVLEYFFWLKK